MKNGARLPGSTPRLAGIFLHTYHSWLDHTGGFMGVQQKLMRHSQISTKINMYGNALMETTREANAAVVSKVLTTA